MSIQWFPGHMAKARREVEEKLKVVDLIIELRDARAPESSENPMLQSIIKNKRRLIVLMKKDLADPNQTLKWLKIFSDKGLDSIAVDVANRKDMMNVVSKAKELGQKQIERLVSRGMKKRPIRAMVIGIPNVGKSTLINRLAGKKVTRIGDRPGVTKHQQWIKVDQDFELLDTPGILWPKFEDEQVGLRLAAIGTIKDRILPLQDVTAYVITYFQNHYPQALLDRYGIEPQMEDMWDIFVHIGKKRGALESGGKVNFDQVATIVLQDLRSGRLGRITLETP